MIADIKKKLGIHAGTKGQTKIAFITTFTDFVYNGNTYTHTNNRNMRAIINQMTDNDFPVQQPPLGGIGEGYCPYIGGLDKSSSCKQCDIILTNVDGADITCTLYANNLALTTNENTCLLANSYICDELVFRKNFTKSYFDLAKVGKTDRLIEIIKRDLGYKKVSFQEVEETLVKMDDQVKDDPRIQFFLKFAENPFEARPVTVPEQDCPDQVSFEDFIKDKPYCLENKTMFKKCVKTYCKSYQNKCLGEVFFYEDYVNEEAL